MSGPKRSSRRASTGLPADRAVVRPGPSGTKLAVIAGLIVVALITTPILVALRRQGLRPRTLGVGAGALAAAGVVASVSLLLGKTKEPRWWPIPALTGLAPLAGSLMAGVSFCNGRGGLQRECGPMFEDRIEADFVDWAVGTMFLGLAAVVVLPWIWRRRDRRR